MQRCVAIPRTELAAEVGAPGACSWVHAREADLVRSYRMMSTAGRHFCGYGAVPPIGDPCFVRAAGGAGLI